MDIDMNKILGIIGNNAKFTSPFNEPHGYYICAEEAGSNLKIDEEAIELYLQKLSYASKNADTLIQQAFQPDFYHFYGVDREKLNSSDDMCSQLIFDSFVLFVKDRRIGVCLSNDNFMRGHLIECCWDEHWNLIYSRIC